MYRSRSRIVLVLLLFLQVVRSIDHVVLFRRQVENAVNSATVGGTAHPTTPTEASPTTSRSSSRNENETSTATTTSMFRSTKRQFVEWTSMPFSYKSSSPPDTSTTSYGNFSVEIEEQFIKLYENTETWVYLRFVGLNEIISIKVRSRNEDVFEVLNSSLQFNPNDHSSHNGTLIFNLKGSTLGVSSLFIAIYDQHGESIIRDDVKFTVKTLRVPRVIDKMFDLLLLPLIVVCSAGMGCRMDIEIIKTKLKKPVSILIGPICQFISQPLFAFSISRFMKFGGLTALGLVTVGSCPGGGMSNMITLLIGADLIQSVTMTFTSNVCALGMLPLNMYIYGSYFMRLIVEEGGDGASFAIPIADIIFQIGLLAGPILLGMFLRYKVPKVAFYINKSLGVISMTLLLLTLGIGVYSNFYVITTSGWQLMAGAALLPNFGFITGFLVARFLTRQPWDSSMTVSVETGVQNNLIAISMIKLAYPQPEADMMARLPIIVSITALSVGVGMVLVSYPIQRFRRQRKMLKDSERDWSGKYDSVKHYEEIPTEKTGVQVGNEIAPSKEYTKLADEGDDV